MTIPFGPMISATALAQELADVIVCDVRWYLDGRSGRAAYDAGHIDGAVFVDLDVDLADPPCRPGGRHPLPAPERFAATMGRLGIGDASRVVAYDDAGGVVASRLWWMLDSIGVAAAVLDGGIDAWSGPLTQTTTEPVPAVFTAQPWPADRFVDASAVAARPADAVVVDARSAERYRGDANPIDPRFGHIPGARSRPTSDNLVDGHVRPAAELRSELSELGIGPDTDVIASCGSGVSACHDLLALRIAGLGNGRLYVGSWSDWGADPERPIETGDDVGRAGDQEAP